MHTCTCSHTHTHTHKVISIQSSENFWLPLLQVLKIQLLSCFRQFACILISTCYWVGFRVWLFDSHEEKEKRVCVMICVLGTWLWLDLQCLHYRLFKCQVASGEVLEVCPALDWHHQNVSALYAFCVILFMGILKKKRCLCWDCSRETVLWKDSVY